MRVCFYHAEPEWSGRSRAFSDAATALRARGAEVTMVCTRATEVERRLIAAGHDVIGIRTRGRALRVGWRLRRILRRNFVEAVFVHSEREHLEAAIAVRLADRGAVVRRMPPFGRMTLGSAARFASRLATTAFLFAFDADLRAARFPAGKLASFVAPPGVRAAGAAAGGSAHGGTTRIACVFDETTRGSVSIALRTLALLAERHPALCMSLIGPRDAGDAFRMQAASLGIVSRVEFPGALPGSFPGAGTHDGAVLGWILAATDDAMFGIVDCFSHGVPVVAERNPLSAHLVTDEENGVLTPPASAAQHAALIAGLLADPAKLDRLAAGARAAGAAWPLEAMAAGFERAAAM